MNILEIGCGDGGNLLPFSEMGCNTTGIDIAESRIKDAKRFFKEVNAKGMFIASDVFKINDLENCFDIVICHDVLEHIDNKERFLIDLKKFLSAMWYTLIIFVNRSPNIDFIIRICIIVINY